MIRKPLFSLGLLLLLGIVSVLGIPMQVEGSAPQLLEVRLNAARGPAPSRYHKVRHEHFVDGPGRVANDADRFYNTLPILHRDGWALPTDDNRLTLEDSPRAAYYRAGDAFEVTLKFNEPVQVDISNPPTLYTDADGFVGDCIYVAGTGTDELTFRDIVQEGEHTFGGLGFVSQALWQNILEPTTPGGRVKGTTPRSNPSKITDLEGNEFNQRADIQIQFWAFLTGMPEILTDPTITSQDAGDRLKIGTPPGEKYDDAYFRGLIKHLVDTIPATVWIPGLIKNGDTHTDDRRDEVVSVVTYTRMPPTYEPDDFTVDINETTTQKDAFDVEFRFFNYDSRDERVYPGPDVFADEVGTSFEPEDVQISGPRVTRRDWDVTLTYVGLDLRAANQWPGDWQGRMPGSSHGPGEVKRSPSFLVYKATITPPSGFEGEVEISLEQGATMDIAGNPSKASNRLTVPVNTPSVQVARPAGDTGVVVEDFTVHFNFGGNVVGDFDAEKISLTQPDGTALDWNVAVTQPTSPRTTVSAVITPALSFNGEVHIMLAGRAVTFEGDYRNLAAREALVVTVDTVPPQVSEAPKIVARPPGEAYTGDDELTVEVPFDEAGVSYEGDNPPYVVLYLGERVLANARHATWKKGAERAGSTIVPFVYPIRAGDTATSLSIDERGVLIPAGTRVVDGDGNELLGQAPPAVAPTEPVTQLPAATGTDERLPFPPTMEEAALTFDISETPVVTYVPILEPTEEPRSPASDVPRSPIVFNELGNGSGDANDWLELRNVTGAAVSLKDWELSVVQDGKQEDTSLIVFPDVSVPANGLLLITQSDLTAAGNVLAGGDDVSTAKVEVKGASHLYLVQSGLSLPDDGQFLLILRKAKEKLGLDEAFVDVAGGGGSDTDAFIREQTGLYDTYVWPLQVLEAPSGDTEESLGSGKVWQRADADKVGYHKDAWAEAAFTGLGYDRKVAKSAATAGTPGYPNGALKPTASTPKGSVTFSEIMFDSAGGTLPQWIELYNTSKTEVLNLNRWELEIQNVDSEDLVGRPIVTLTLQEKLIQPNQTLLIVAGNARASSGTSLPADRIYNLLKLHEKNLRIKKPQDTFLSEEGFYLKLTDANGHLVDEIGNTDGNRRTTDAPKWVLRRSDVEGSRSSLVRRYEKGGIAEEGTEAASWVLAANVAKIAASELHYGHADDIGTPGHRRGGALPVELSSFSVKRNEAGAVVVTWATESEVDNAGFNLRRSLTRDSGFTLLNPVLIAGAGTTGERQTYTFTDTSAKPGVEYYYQIEEVAFDGKRETLATRMLRGPVSAANRALTTFGAVKQKD